MAWTTFFEDWAKAKFGSGTLAVEIKIRREVDCYGPPPDVLARRLVFIKGDKRRRLATLQALSRLADSEGIHLVSQVRRRPIPFAELVAELENLGRVLYRRPRTTLRNAIFEDYGIDLRKCRPKVERGCLRFRVVSMGLFVPIPRPVSEICLDLTELSFTSRVVGHWNPTRRTQAQRSGPE
jgi:hypothetical protein